MKNPQNIPEEAYFKQALRDMGVMAGFGDGNDEWSQPSLRIEQGNCA